MAQDEAGQHKGALNGLRETIGNVTLANPSALPPTTMVPAQCRAARAWLGWTQAELAHRAGVATTTVADFERGVHRPTNSNLRVISEALGKEGIAFAFHNNKPVGILYGGDINHTTKRSRAGKMLKKPKTKPLSSPAEQKRVRRTRSRRKPAGHRV